MDLDFDEYEDIEKEIDSLKEKVDRTEARILNLEERRCECGHSWFSHYKSANHTLCDEGDKCECKKFVEQTPEREG